MTSHVMLDGSHKGNTWDWLKIISWSMMDGELKWWITLGDTPLIGGGFSEVMWSTLGHSHFRERFYWRYSHSTQYSALGHILLIDGWFLRWRFILRHSPLIGDKLWFILEHSHCRWSILGHSHFIHIHKAREFWFIWIVLRCFRFWHQE